jgi:hypothetical protein
MLYAVTESIHIMKNARVAPPYYQHKGSSAVVLG